jgi:hypothetical protein
MARKKKAGPRSASCSSSAGIDKASVKKAPAQSVASTPTRSGASAIPRRCQ